MSIPAGLPAVNPVGTNPAESRGVVDGDTKGPMGPREVPLEHAGSSLGTRGSMGSHGNGIRWDAAVISFHRILVKVRP